MFALIDSKTKEVIARFESESYARIAGQALSKEFRRQLTVVRANSEPVVRYIDGAEFPVPKLVFIQRP